MDFAGGPGPIRGCIARIFARINAGVLKLPGGCSQGNVRPFICLSGLDSGHNCKMLEGAIYNLKNEPHGRYIICSIRDHNYAQTVQN